MLAAAGTRVARCATTVSPFASVAIEHNSNVFMRPADSPPFASSGITALGDTIKDYEVGVDAKFSSGNQILTLNGSAERQNYNRFSFLNHYEYDFGGELVWRLGHVLSGNLSYRQRRYAALFTDTLSTALLVDTERTGIATVRILVSPKWRIDLTPEVHQLDMPLTGYPDFRLRETLGSLGIDYLGFGRLTAGLRFDYDHGRYAGIVAATRYDQKDAVLTASYKVGGFSTFNANVGYTQRDTEPNPDFALQGTAAAAGNFAAYQGLVGSTSSVTGELAYQRQLTGKTSAGLSLFRRIASYIAGANPEIQTGATITASWKPDVKFTLRADYSYMRDQIQGGLVVASAFNRTDRTQVGNFEVRYAALSWLSIRPYINWQRATSSFRLGNYTATIVGIRVAARPQW